MSKWWWRADYVETCNCAHGCPCNFTMIPTHGGCHGIDAFHIREGECDGVRLDGAQRRARLRLARTDPSRARSRLRLHRRARDAGPARRRSRGSPPARPGPAGHSRSSAARSMSAPACGWPAAFSRGGRHATSTLGAPGASRSDRSFRTWTAAKAMRAWYARAASSSRTARSSTSTRARARWGARVHICQLERVHRGGRLQRVNASAREALPGWIALLVVAALAWRRTLADAAMMGDAPGTMGMPLLPFIAMWVPMMAAMMLPAITPVATLWTGRLRARPFGRARLAAAAVCGRLHALWTGAGVLAYAMMRPVEFGARGRPVLRPARPPSTVSSRSRALPALAAARSVPGQMPLAVSVLLGRDRRARLLRDLRAGALHGAWCLACCWSLMACWRCVGLMNVTGDGGAGGLHLPREDDALRRARRTGRPAC